MFKCVFRLDYIIFLKFVFNFYLFFFSYAIFCTSNFFPKCFNIGKE